MGSATLCGAEFQKPTQTEMSRACTASCSIHQVRAPETDYSMTPGEAAAGCVTTLTNVGETPADRVVSPTSVS